MSGYLTVLADVRKVATECGRDPADIKLIAVSKGCTLQEVQEVYRQGCRDFGENRIQETFEKKAQAAPDIRWHMIGSLQKNKVAKIIGQYALIHSVDSVELAQKLATTSQTLTQILLQVNTSGESTKHGLSPREWRPNMAKLFNLPHLQIQGLMTMAPLTDDQTLIRKTFADLRLFRDELVQIHGYALPHLSMGMSHDYRIAIEEGATLLRIGSAIFKTFN